MYFLQFVSLYIHVFLLLSADDNRSIYIETKLDKTYLNALEGEDSREKGFLWGTNTSENGAWQSFGVDKCLKMLYF